MRVQYLASAVRTGLRRNLTLTIAVVVSVAISLFFFGAGWLAQKQVDTMKGYWYDKVEVSVFLCNEGDEKENPSCAGGAVTDAQRDQIEADLKSLPQVEKVYYESQAEAYKNFLEQYEDSAISENVTEESLPESFRVKLKDPEQFEIVASAFEGRSGVYEVQDQREVLERFFDVLNMGRMLAWGVAAIQLVAAAMLISNTVRIAAFSRRRETGIMRLVGASNFYIQLPFLLEGAVAGLVGAGLASALLLGLQHRVVTYVSPRLPSLPFAGMDAAWSTVPILLAIGVLMASIASFISLRKYLRV